MIAQRQGAKAVVATLWPVADASTPQLMRTLYTRRAANPGVSKADALRYAQVALLEGKGSGNAVATPARTRIAGENQRVGRAALCPPVYWAPFVLIGNWR